MGGFYLKKKKNLYRHKVDIKIFKNFKLRSFSIFRIELKNRTIELQLLKEKL